MDMDDAATFTSTESSAAKVLFAAGLVGQAAENNFSLRPVNCCSLILQRQQSEPANKSYFQQKNLPRWTQSDSKSDDRATNINHGTLFCVLRLSKIPIGREARRDKLMSKVRFRWDYFSGFSLRRGFFYAR
jgi:hypothetical protein